MSLVGRTDSPESESTTNCINLGASLVTSNMHDGRKFRVDGCWPSHPMSRKYEISAKIPFSLALLSASFLGMT